MTSVAVAMAASLSPPPRPAASLPLTWSFSCVKSIFSAPPLPKNPPNETIPPSTADTPAAARPFKLESP